MVVRLKSQLADLERRAAATAAAAEDEHGGDAEVEAAALAQQIALDANKVSFQSLAASPANS